MRMKIILILLIANLVGCSPFSVMMKAQQTTQTSSNGDEVGAGTSNSQQGFVGLVCMFICYYVDVGQESGSTEINSVQESVASVLKEVGTVNETTQALQEDLQRAEEREEVMHTTIQTLNNQNSKMAGEVEKLQRLNRALYGDEDVNQEQLQEIVN